MSVLVLGSINTDITTYGDALPRIGETGETGSGKTTFGRLLLGLYRPTSGDILYQGASVLDRRGAAARAARRTVSRASSRTRTRRGTPR